jgi:thymidylate synthase (FAD)
LSQRYVDESNVEFVKPSGLGDFDPAAELLDGDVHRESDSVTGSFLDICISLRDIYTKAVEELLKRGMTRKESRQAARAILPNMTETKIVVTGNMRAWRDMLKKRWHVAADAEICEFAGMILDQLRSIAPNTFQDIPGRPYGSEEQ